MFLSLAASSGCAPPPPSGDNQDSSASAAPDDMPELNNETINERINGAFVRKVPEENAAAEPINWTFDQDEPKEIQIVEKQVSGSVATTILDIKTSSAKYAREQRVLAGQIRVTWRLETGWMLRRWEIIKVENISLKYRNLPKPPAQNSNR